MRKLCVPLAAALLAAFAQPAAVDPDTDGDGLSDYAEIHKYFTDPHKADTAGAGKSDGDWTSAASSPTRSPRCCNWPPPSTPPI